jgi:hypothetical protein
MGAAGCVGRGGLRIRPTACTRKANKTAAANAYAYAHTLPCIVHMKYSNSNTPARPHLTSAAGGAFKNADLPCCVMICDVCACVALGARCWCSGAGVVYGLWSIALGGGAVLCAQHPARAVAVYLLGALRALFCAIAIASHRWLAARYNPKRRAGIPIRAFSQTPSEARAQSPTCFSPVGESRSALQLFLCGCGAIFSLLRSHPLHPHPLLP